MDVLEMISTNCWSKNSSLDNRNIWNLLLTTNKIRN